MIAELLTAEQFAAGRDELPDGGRWTELHAGRVITLSPPETEHGTAVLNISKAIATHAKPDEGYACFDLGLIVQRSPDTVRCPAISFFSGGPAFAESDKIVTDTRPRLVVEVASSNDRRRNLADRLQGWLDWQVELVWLLDTIAKQVHVFERGRQPHRLAGHQTLLGGSVLRAFESNVGDLFQEPSWWRGTTKKPGFST
jgi:Uma2 family endonuclease